MSYLGPKRGLDAGHHQRRLKSLSRNISNRYAEFASRKTKHVVKVSAHNFGWTVHYTTLDVVEIRHVTLKQPTLHIDQRKSLGGRFERRMKRAYWLVREKHCIHSLILSLLTIRWLHRVGVTLSCHSSVTGKNLQRRALPPSTNTSIPVIPLLSPDARYTAAWAISSGPAGFTRGGSVESMLSRAVSPSTTNSTPPTSQPSSPKRETTAS